MSWGTPVGAGNLATPSATTIAVTLTGVAVGDTVTVWVKWEGGSTTATCSDGTSTLTGWAPGVISRPASADPFGKAFYILASVASGSVTYTVTLGAGRTFREIVAYRSTPSAAAALDGTAVGANGSSTAASSGNTTTTSTDGLAFGVYGDFGNTESAEKINAVAAGGNTHAAANASEMWYKTYSAGFTGPAAVTLGISNDWLCGIIAFGIGGGGGGTKGPPTLPGFYRPRFLTPRIRRVS